MKEKDRLLLGCQNLAKLAIALGLEPMPVPSPDWLALYYLAKVEPSYAEELADAWFPAVVVKTGANCYYCLSRIF